MSDQKIEALIAKHPHLSKEEATKIIADKNQRKKKKRSEKTAKATEKKVAYEARKSKPNESLS
jgi:hypothetical protein